MIRFTDFFPVNNPNRTKVKFNMKDGDRNLRAWDYLINDEECLRAYLRGLFISFTTEKVRFTP